MADLKRDEIKYIRDLAKSAYTKNTECEICDSTEELQFHHYYSMTLLWEKWKKKEKISIDSVEHIMSIREDFKAYHVKEIYTDTVTLCKSCHMDKLHKIYGKVPPLATAEKQKRWVQKQKIKHQEKLNGITSKK